jgi:hypothetical protein
MFDLLQRLLGKRSEVKGGTRRQSAVRLQLETLEDRQVPSVSFHGGSVIPHAQVTNVYYGQDWSQQANQSDIQNLNQFTKTITGSSYMSMLGEYGVGMGSYQGSDVQASGPAANTTVSESTIQNMLAGEILSYRVPAPSASTVYAVYLPPNVHSQLDVQYSDMAHHNSFLAPVGYWYWNGSSSQYGIYYTRAYYAVVPHPQGNLADNGYNLTSLTSDFQKQTELLSHELAETVTDPQVWQDSSGWHGTGWHDGTNGNYLGNEIGDLVNQQVAWLDGYAVQREWSNYFQTGIAPAWDTSGGYTYWGGWSAQGSTQTAQGRHGLVAIQQYGPLQYNWQLDDGSYAGWFIVG